LQYGSVHSCSSMGTLLEIYVLRRYMLSDGIDNMNLPLLAKDLFGGRTELS